MGSRRQWLLFPALGLLALGAGLFLRRETPSFDEALRRAPALDSLPVESVDCFSRAHTLAPVRYPFYPPACGPHHPVPQPPGFYTSPQPWEKLVHAMEHGNVVVYYDRPGSEAQAALKAWAERFSNPWGGLVIVPLPGLGQGVVLTAWTAVPPPGQPARSEGWGKRLRLERFDPAEAAAFIAAFLGKGLEGPMQR